MLRNRSENGEFQQDDQGYVNVRHEIRRETVVFEYGAVQYVRMPA